MTRKRLWMNRISGIVCLLLWIALVIFLSGTTGKIAGMALGIMLLVAVIYNLYLPKEVSTHLIIPAYAQKEEKILDLMKWVFSCGNQTAQMASPS